MAFYVGQKVVFLGGASSGYGNETMPEIGAVYTVRAATLVRDVENILLVEIVNAPRAYAEGTFEGSFAAECFRPAVEPTQSVFDEYIAPIFNRNRERESV